MATVPSAVECVFQMEEVLCSRGVSLSSPRKRAKYSSDVSDGADSRGVLDNPLSRGMTVWFEEATPPQFLP
jgi:hypothetical protein